MYQQDSDASQNVRYIAQGVIGTDGYEPFNDGLRSSAEFASIVKEQTAPAAKGQQD